MPVVKYLGRVTLATIALAFARPSAAAESWTFQTLQEQERGREAFTQGLEIRDGVLYESSGLYGRSFVRRVDLETGAELQRVALPNEFFAEGLTLFGERLYVLTWREGTLLVYDASTLERLETLSYSGEGWGLTHNGTSLIQSDGTNVIRFRDPNSFAVQSTIAVRDGATPVTQLNELEWIDGRIWANVWFDRRIAVIDPDTGSVDAWIDLAPITQRWTNVFTGAVLNGIARDPTDGRVWVTGKLWPRLYKLQVAPFVDPLPQPELKAERTENAQLSLRFGSFYRAQYHLESSPSLGEVVWETLPGSQTGDGFEITVPLAPSDRDSLFWRARAATRP